MTIFKNILKAGWPLLFVKWSSRIQSQPFLGPFWDYLESMGPLGTTWGLCLVLLQVPKCFVLVQIFCTRPNIYLHIVAVTNILCQTKRWFAFSKIDFCASTKGFEEALKAVKFLGWLKRFGLAQNILGPVKGQGIIQLL